MGYSLKLKIDTYDPRHDGTCAIYFQVIINRKKKRIGLPICWPPDKFNLKKEEPCQSRKKDDPDVDVYNIVINNARTKANEIRKQYLLKGWNLTMDVFLREYNSDLNKNDFIDYVEKKAFTRWKDREISDRTYRNEKVVINLLKKFQPSIPFNTFNLKWVKEWDKFLKKSGHDINTRWGDHKIVMTYLGLARDVDKITFEDPYERFVNKMVESSWGPLNLDQMKKLLVQYLEWRDKPLPFLKKKRGVIDQEDTRPGLTTPEVQIARKFLFSCNSALRISDIQKLDESLFDQGQMSITPHKTERFGTKINSMPLNDIARMLLDDEIADVRTARDKKPLLRIFERNCTQYCNRALKTIAKKAGINTNLHMHVGRYTFGSLSDEAGANHTALMKQMGIKKRDTLEKYVKTNSKVIDSNVDKMNTLVNLDSVLSKNSGENPAN